jgi:DNA-binding transcriptional regulator YdaS (Cro superfamily)
MHALLIACGQALYGQQWQSALARDLGVSDRTMRRWVAGEQSVPAGVALDLLRLTEERAGELGTLADQLRAAM